MTMSTRTFRPTWRCASCRSSRCWSRRASSTNPLSTRWSTRTSARSGRATARASWRVPGAILRTSRGCSTMRTGRSPNWGTPACRASTWWWSRIRHGAQRRGVHTVFLLSMAGAGPAARMVQVVGLPLASRHRSARRVAGVRHLDPAGRGGARLGQHGRNPLPGPSERPAGCAHLNEEELARLVTRDAMVGVVRDLLPAPAESA